MLDNTSRYIYEIYKQKGVSKAAQKLFVSQPALSNTLKKAEENLGAPIFNRKTHPFSLTDEGKIYIEAIEKILAIESGAYDKISDKSRFKSGTLKIGISTALSYHVVPKICEVFCKRFPDIDINIINSATDKLYDLIEKEEANLIFIPTYSAPEGYVCETLFEEKFVVAVRRDYPGIDELKKYALTYDEVVSGSYSRKKELDSTEPLKALEFIYNPPSSHIYKKRGLLVAETDFNSHIVTTSNHFLLNYNLMLSGFGALLTTDANIAAMHPDERCVFFVIKNRRENESFSIVYSAFSGSFSKKLTEEFVSDAKKLFSLGNHLLNLKTKKF